MNNMPSALRKQFLLHARKPVFQKRVEAALKTIKAFLEKARNPYIAVSGGKDSSVLLSLCRQIVPDLDAVHLDFHTAYPETLTLFKTYENLKCIDVGSRLEMLREEGMDSKSKKGKLRNFDVERIQAEGYDGYFYGLRASESAGRRKLLRTKGAYFQRKTVYGCASLSHTSHIMMCGLILLASICNITHSTIRCGNDLNTNSALPIMLSSKRQITVQSPT